MTNILAPMIYVACLAAYNSGTLYGQWIDANQSPAALNAAVFDMLAGSPIPKAEEWAIHDYQEFGEISLSEYTGLAEVSRLSGLIVEHGRPFTAFAAYFGSEYATEDHFIDAYQGEHESCTDFSRELFDEIYGAELPGILRFYIDDELFARDLFISDYLDMEAPTGIYVFRNL